MKKKLKKKKQEIGQNVQFLKPKLKNVVKQESSSYLSDVNVPIEEHIDDVLENQLIVPNDLGKMVVTVDSNNEDLQVKIAAMREKIDDGEGNKWRCAVCGKLGKDRSQIGRHIECHIEGVSHPCNL